VSFYLELARDSWHTRSWADKVKRWFAAPGWRPADVAAMFPGEPFELRRAPYDPPLSAARQALAFVAFVAAMVGTWVLLWFAPHTERARLGRRSGSGRRAADGGGLDQHAGGRLTGGALNDVC
jgi:hypothetical protein